MREQVLIGYLLHHKPYQESRALYYFFSDSHGVISGIGKKGMPLFKKIQLFANGKRSLKNFSQIQQAPVSMNIEQSAIHLDSVKQSLSMSGQNLYAGFYLNEILWKVLGAEDIMYSLWKAYEVSVQNLHQELTSLELKILLRHFESIFFAELGCGFSLVTDAAGDVILANNQYLFVADEGFYVYKVNNDNNLSGGNLYDGANLLAIENYKNSNIELSAQNMLTWSRLHKQVIDHLLDHKVLQSRELWKQFIRYS